MTRIFSGATHELASENEKMFVAVLSAMAVVWIGIPAIQRCYLTGLPGMSDGFVAFPEALQPLPHPFIASLVLAMVFSFIAVRRTKAGLFSGVLLLVAAMVCLCVDARSAASRKDTFWVTDFPDMHIKIAVLYDTGSTVYARELDGQGRFTSQEKILIIPNPNRDLGPVRLLRTIAR